MEKLKVVKRKDDEKMLDLLYGRDYKKAFERCNKVRRVIIFLRFDMNELVEGKNRQLEV